MGQLWDQRIRYAHALSTGTMMIALRIAMSEPAPERSSGGGNVLTRKVGPLPMWGWMAIVAVLALVYSMYKKNKTPSTAAAASGTPVSSVPQFVNQTYVNGTPPSAPDPTRHKRHPQTPVTVQIPNGSGGWMTAIFPSQQAEQSYYTSLGIGAGQPNGGYYPNGLTNAQLTQAVTEAGGYISTSPPTSTLPLKVNNGTGQ